MILFQKSFSQRITALILVICLVGLIAGPILLYPRKAQATCQVEVTNTVKVDDKKLNNNQKAWKALWNTFKTENLLSLAKIVASWLWKKAQDLVMWALGVALNLLLHQILAELTNDIIEWIQGGGKPRFLAGNISDWLENAADKAAGAFITQYLGAGWLCETFDIDMRIGLAKVPAFEEEVKCTLSDIVGNIRGFHDDFSQGGWKGWVELTKPRNNLYGAYLLSQAEMMSTEERAARERENELEMGEGFLSPKDCTWYDKNGRMVEHQTDVWGEPSLPSACYPDPANPGRTRGGFASPCHHKCTIYTPASTVKAVTDKAVTNYWDQINAQIAAATAKAGPYSVYIQAIISALINRVLTEGKGLLFAEPVPDPAGGGGVVVPPIIDPTQVLQDLSDAESLLAQLRILRVNLETNLLAEQQNNLAVLYLILEAYQELLPLLDQVIEACTDTPYTTYVAWAQNRKASIENNVIPSLEQRIAQMEDEIEHTVYVIGLTDRAMALVEDYIVKANTWLEIWEAVGGNPDNPDLIAATEALAEAQAAAIGAVQNVVREINGFVLSSNFGGLTQEVVEALNNVINEAFNLEEQRGDPSWPEAGTLYGELAAANNIRSAANSYITTCNAWVPPPEPPPGNGGNGNGA